MKLIVTRSNSDGTFDEVGMNRRRLFNGTSKPHMVRKAKSCFPDQDLRLEWFTDSGIYGEPFDPVPCRLSSPRPAGHVPAGFFQGPEMSDNRRVDFAILPDPVFPLSSPGILWEPERMKPSPRLSHETAWKGRSPRTASSSAPLPIPRPSAAYGFPRPGTVPPPPISPTIALNAI